MLASKTTTRGDPGRRSSSDAHVKPLRPAPTTSTTGSPILEPVSGAAGEKFRAPPLPAASTGGASPLNEPSAPLACTPRRLAPARPPPTPCPTSLGTGGPARTEGPRRRGGGGGGTLSSAAMQAGLAEVTDGRCQFVLPRKNRRCGLLAAPGGGGFCGNHQPPGDGGGAGGAPLRVPCPVDPSHTVLASKLAQHVAKCPKATEARRLRQQSFFRADCNRPVGRQEQPAPDSSSSKAVRARMEGMDGPDFEALVARVAAAARQLGLPELGEGTDAVECLAPPQLQPWLTGIEWLKSENRVHEPRHAVQRVSIAAHVAGTAGLWGDPPPQAPPGAGVGACAREGPGLDEVSVVELGAGRGYVGAMLAEAGKVRHCVLNDVRSYRNKADRVLRKVGAARVERATCDLKDFCLAEMESLQDRRCVVVGKHLCGGATDLALRCIAACRSPNSPAEGPGARPCVLALGIATCCHHRCTLDTYVGAEVLGELGFAARDLEHIFWLSAWATLRGGGHGAPEAPGREDLYFSSIPLERRVETGRRCKQLVDAGRLEWLRRRGYKASGVRYVAREVTPENHLLLGH